MASEIEETFDWVKLKIPLGTSVEDASREAYFLTDKHKGKVVSFILNGIECTFTNIIERVDNGR